MLHGLETAFQDVANVIPGMIAQGEAFALNVQDIAVKSGASDEVASRFAGTLTYLGQSVEGLGMSLKTLSVQIVKNEGQFKSLGIETRDSNGNLLDTITILDNVRSYLSTTGDGAAKLALATHLLGKSAGNLIEFLSLTDEQAAFLNKMLDNLAVTMGGDAVAAAVGLKREENLLGLAWQGLSNTLLTAVVPALRQFIGGIIEFVATHGPRAPRDARRHHEHRARLRVGARRGIGRHAVPDADGRARRQHGQGDRDLRAVGPADGLHDPEDRQDHEQRRRPGPRRSTSRSSRSTTRSPRPRSATTRTRRSSSGR